MDNIMNAIASVPLLYTQVLHLMNKMNLPTPFGKQRFPEASLKRRRIDLDTFESEIESEDDSKQKWRISLEPKRNVSPEDCSKEVDKKCSDVVGYKAIESSNRMSIEQIKSISAFSSYESGKPSCTLFLKNLAFKDVEEKDLREIYSKYGRCEIRILEGKMRGQAFVKYENVEAASTALELTLGYILYGKPLVVCFGRSQH